MAYDYIPDMAERFPEGFGGVDMTPSYFGEEVDWSRAYGYEPTYEELVEDGEYGNEDKRTEEELDNILPFDFGTESVFERGHTYITHGWFTGATMKYTYEGRDKKQPSIGIFSIDDFEIDGDHYRTEKHDILTDDNGNEYIVIGEYEGHSHCVYAEDY